MSNDQVTIWGAGLKFGRKPEDGELLIGNGSSFDLATLSAGSGISISNTSGAVTISASGGGTVTAVTATSPLKSSGGTAPDISLDGTVAVSNGGTGRSSLTADNVILGDGTNAVKFVAPGASGNLLTSNGTTWASAAPQVQWTRIVRTTDQTYSSTTFADDNTLQFSISANKVYAYRGVGFVLTANAGAMKNSVSGPASPTYVRLGLGTFSAYQTAYGATVSATNTANILITVPFAGVISNGANAGTVAITWAQNAGPSGTLTVYAGSWIEWGEIA